MRRTKAKQFETVLLVDGNNIANRAYYAVDPRLTAPDGTPTNAVKGFFNILYSDIKKTGVTHVGIVFDKGGCDFRTSIYPEYKGNRVNDAKKDSIRAQMQIIKRLLKAAGFAVLSKQGVEADDIIGSCTKSLVEVANLIISTNDKDFAQLLALSERENSIGLLWPKLDYVGYRDQVVARYGVPPESIVDWLCLMSDDVDNIKGVYKCGEKTAAKLLLEHGDLATLKKNFRNGVKIGAAGLTKNFEEAFDRLTLNKRLITIRKNLLRVELDKFQLSGYADEVGFNKLCRKYGLSSLVEPMRKLHNEN